MVQDQLVEYISTQVKLGASRDAIKSALVGAGWQAGDVEDSFKKVEGAAQPMKAAQPASSPNAAIGGGVAAKPMQTGGATGASANAFFGGKPAATTSGPQVIRMSDLVSPVDSPVTSIGKSSVAATTNSKSSASAGMTMGSSSPAKSKTMLIGGIVVAVLILGLGGLAGYFFMQNTALSSQISSVNGQSANVASQISALNGQVNALTASSTANATVMAGLTSANQELMKELSLYAVPAGTTATTSQISITGSLGINASKMYFVTGSFGGKVIIANSKDPKALTVLAPLVGSSTQVSGTYVPGTDSMTVTAVNGTSL